MRFVLAILALLLLFACGGSSNPPPPTLLPPPPPAGDVLPFQVFGTYHGTADLAPVFGPPSAAAPHDVVVEIVSGWVPGETFGLVAVESYPTLPFERGWYDVQTGTFGLFAPETPGSLSGTRLSGTMARKQMNAYIEVGPGTGTSPAIMAGVLFASLATTSATSTRDR